MKIFTNSENEKFLEVKTAQGIVYRSFKTGIYYENKGNKMVVAINPSNADIYRKDR